VVCFPGYAQIPCQPTCVTTAAGGWGRGQERGLCFEAHEIADQGPSFEFCTCTGRETFLRAAPCGLF
jgi:hypothetical protein